MFLPLVCYDGRTGEKERAGVKAVVISLAICLAASLFTGCAGAGSRSWTDAEFRQLVKEYNQKADRDDQVVCEKVPKTGSFIRTWQCRKKWSMKVEKIEQDDMLIKLELKGSQPGKH